MVLRCSKLVNSHPLLFRDSTFIRFDSFEPAKTSAEPTPRHRQVREERPKLHGLNLHQGACMTAIELHIVSILRALVEVAGMFLLAQGILFLLAGARRDKNIVYQLFRIITRPVVQATRFITPRVIVDKHIPFVAFFILFWLWLLLAYVKQIL
jgi:hypothetical protein